MTVTLLACRCGAPLPSADMRRLPPLVEGPTNGVIVDPIVCPGCLEARLSEIAALDAPADDETEVGS